MSNEGPYYTVTHWRDYQHYRDRNPPWIKLHFSLLSSRDWVMLDDASRVLAVACMLIASRNDGRVPADPDYVKRVAYLNKRPDFNPLIECGFLQDASGCKQMLADARPEERQRRDRDRGETEADTRVTSDPQHAPRKANGQEIENVFALLCKLTGKGFSTHNPAGKRTAGAELLAQRFREGYSEQDARWVVGDRCATWKDDDKMAQYLTPATLFRKSNFEKYVALTREAGYGDSTE